MGFGMGFGIWDGMGLGFGTDLGLEWVWDLGRTPNYIYIGSNKICLLIIGNFLSSHIKFCLAEVQILI